MKGFLKIVGWLACAYLAAGVCAWLVLPAKVAEAERARLGVTLALDTLAADQLAVSRRVSEITAQTLDRGRDKAEQVSQLLGDATLNRIARTYTGEDWAVARSGFVGEVRHLRERQRAHKDERKSSEGRLESKVDRIEYRKRQLLRNMNTPRDTAHRHLEEQWREELRDLDRQLSTLRDTSQYREKLDKPRAPEGGTAKADDSAVYKLATDCEAKTVGRLAQVMSAKAKALEAEGSKSGRYGQWLSYFDIWPLNRLANKTSGE